MCKLEWPIYAIGLGESIGAVPALQRLHIQVWLLIINQYILTHLDNIGFLEGFLITNLDPNLNLILSFSWQINRLNNKKESHEEKIFDGTSWLRLQIKVIRDSALKVNFWQKGSRRSIQERGFGSYSPKTHDPNSQIQKQVWAEVRRPYVIDKVYSNGYYS